MTLWTDLLGSEITYRDGEHRSRVLTAGAGDPLLLLHGQGGHLENFRHNIPAYAKTYRVIAPDFLWHGLSDKPAVPRDMIGALVDQLVGLLDGLSIPTCFIEGQSMGGWVATELALRYPERVRALVLTTPMGLRAWSEGPDASRLAAVLRSQLLALDTVTTEQTRQRMTSLFADPAVLDDEIVELRTRIFSDPESNRALRAVAEKYFSVETNLELQIGQDRLGELSPPTLVYWGTANSVPPEQGRKIADSIPRNEWHCAEAGHWAQYEQWEEHNDVVLEFLSRH
ncbi:alpha/beta fold hydrolase [Leifsonia sp. H3M29-4]|uniref:alpha/beta hydrolase n=1 Tax=Salinibacterium metalliresistens TaxID=3031321 RepID=UPI0023DA88B5|nr:alpha/beta fold hydrolase [Salinibacterium metalliresistens]MDF1480383.1 alpha/beta fold hydrolase [Salinibacterium metalliresistens]